MYTILQSRAFSSWQNIYVCRDVHLPGIIIQQNFQSGKLCWLQSKNSILEKFYDWPCHVQFVLREILVSKSLVNSCLFAFFMYVTRHCYNSDGKIWRTTSGSPNLPGFSSSAKNSRYTVHWKAFADVKKWETTEVFPPRMFCSVYPYERKWWSLNLTMGIKIKKYWTRTVLFTLLHTLWSNNKSTWWSNDLK